MALRSISVLVCVLVFVSTATTSATAPERLTDIELDVKAGRLTFEARGAPLSEVVQRIGKRAGFETILVGDLDAPVDASFTNTPVLRVLNELLRENDRVVVYAPRNEDARDRIIVKLWVFESRRVAADADVMMTRKAALGDKFDDDPQAADEKRRSEAVLMLANDGPEDQVLEALIEALQGDENALVRTRAATALGRLGDERSVPALESALSDEHGSVRIQAIHALGQIDSEHATTALGNVLLHGTDTNERIVAAWGLIRRDSPIAREYLDAIADDPDEQVRAASKRSGVGSRSKSTGLPEQRGQLGAEHAR